MTPPPDASVNALTGVYAVKEVTHSFAGGEFTQTLHGIRDVMVNIRDVDLDSNIRGNISGTDGQTISEQLDGINDAGISLTTASSSVLLSTSVDAKGNDTLTWFGDPSNNTTSGAAVVDENNLTPNSIIGTTTTDGDLGGFTNGRTGPTQLDDGN